MSEAKKKKKMEKERQGDAPTLKIFFQMKNDALFCLHYQEKKRLKNVRVKREITKMELRKKGKKGLYLYLKI